jgi:RHS repeat-associated protein
MVSREVVASHRHDHANRLTQVTQGSQTTQFAYNGDGVRTSKTVDGDTTQYVLDLAATLPVVVSDTEAVYLCGLDIIAQQQADGQYYFYGGLGSVRQLLDSAGEVQTNYAYDPFGVPVVAGDASNPYRFTGEAWDEEVELLYLRARYYQPEVGRFIAEDPWEGDQRTPATLNSYVYVADNPVNLRDPSGSRPDGFLPSWQDPPVVTYIHRQMIDNAQGPIVAQLLEWNSSWSQGMRPGRGKLQAYGLFGYMVWPGHEWDPKGGIFQFTNQYSHKIGDWWYYYDIWGNMMFGYLGSAAGFQEWELLNGAGMVQIPTDLYDAFRRRDPVCLPIPRPWYNIYLPWAWDHPHDRVTARIGIALWKQYDISLQTRDIIHAIVDAGDQIPRLHREWREEDFARMGL